MSALNQKRNTATLDIVLGVALAVVGTGCQTTNPYTAKLKSDKTTKGAGYWCGRRCNRRCTDQR